MKNAPIPHGIHNSRQEQDHTFSTKHVFVQASKQFTCNKVVLSHETVCMQVLTLEIKGNAFSVKKYAQLF